MTVYEQRTYSVTVGRMSEVIRLFTDDGWPALEAAGGEKHLVGAFVSDTGRLHQLIHLFRFDSDGDRREFRQRLNADEAFIAFAEQVRPLLQMQEIQLLVSAPWSPTP